MKQRTRLLAALAFAAACAATPAIASDNDDDFDWRAMSAEWWQWALSIPAPANPVADTTGANCMVGQRGGVWFLAGTTTSGVATRRTCTVPADTPLFFPVVNFVYFNSPNCDQGPEDLSAAYMRGVLDSILDGASGIEAQLDNRPVRHVRRVKSEVFSVALPKDSLFGDLSDPARGTCIPGLVYSPAVDDGYYVRLRGLAAGQHHLAFRGAAGGFSIDVFYTLNAVKVKQR